MQCLRPKKKLARRQERRAEILSDVSGADTATRLDGRQDGKPSSKIDDPGRKLSFGQYPTIYSRMTDKPPVQPSSKPHAKPSRADRLAEALRANLKRRKGAAQSRSGARSCDAGSKSDERDD
jgi:hypothetical protein